MGQVKGDADLLMVRRDVHGVNQRHCVPRNFSGSRLLQLYREGSSSFSTISSQSRSGVASIQQSSNSNGWGAKRGEKESVGDVEGQFKAELAEDPCLGFKSPCVPEASDTVFKLRRVSLVLLHFDQHGAFFSSLFQAFFSGFGISFDCARKTSFGGPGIGEIFGVQIWICSH